MKTQALTLILGILLLTTISALYAGESFTLDIGQDYEYYSVVGNTSEVVLDIQQNGTTLIITPNKYSVDDTYEIIFFNKEKETIYVSSGGGGGGSRTRYVDRNVTEYKDKIEYVDKIVEKEIKTPSEKIIEMIPKGNTGATIIIIVLVIIVLGLLLWNFYKGKDNPPEEFNNRFADEEYNNYTAEKEVKENE